MIKKFLLVVAVTGLLFWIAVLVLIPHPLILSTVVYTKTPAFNVTRYATDSTQWQHWWPQRQASEPFSYAIVSRTPAATQVRIKVANGDTFTSQLTVLPLAPDSSAVQWNAALHASLNPFTRMKQYRQASGIRDNMQLLLDTLAAFVGNPERMYGVAMAVTRFSNPFMISTQAEFKSYPSADEVYRTIGQLRQYARLNQAVPVDSPMIHIEPEGNIYQLRTALPINKKLKAGGDITFKQMVLGKALLATVTGGRYTIEQSLLGMQNFVSDFQLTSPAIPFQLLVTNRQQQPDSSKWVTRLYYPIF